ncbi:MAG: hypothetical protein C0196_05790 [Dictyoglomus turgidum]|nr:MAG: hypothetical protein C0196_05790 [Dictyoglomus turgidum]
MIKVAFLSDFPFSIAFGGKEIQLLSYMEHINNGNFNIRVKLLDFFSMEETFDIIHLFGYSNWFYDIVKNLKNNFPNIKIFVSPTFYYEKETRMLIGSLLSKLCPVPNFFSYKKYFLSKSDLIIVNSNAEKVQLIKLFQIDAPKIEIIYNYVDSSFAIFNNPEDANIFLRKYNLDKDEYFLSVAFLDERKNTLNLLRAFLEVYPILKKKLVLIGKFRFRNNNIKEEVEKLVYTNKDKILHIEYIDRKSDLLKSAYLNCKAHLLPSFLETPGLSNLEAGIFKKPILVGKCKPVIEYFGDKVVYCDPNSIESIKKGILKVNSQSQNIELYDLIRSKYLEKHSVDKLVNLYLSQVG